MLAQRLDQTSMCVHRSRTLEPSSNVPFATSPSLQPVHRDRFTLFAWRTSAARRTSPASHLRGYTATNPFPAGAQRERRHAQLPRGIDDVNDMLLSPFAGGIEYTFPALGAAPVVQRLLALLVFVFGLGCLRAAS